MPILTIRHVTSYHYRQPVAFGGFFQALVQRFCLDSHRWERRLFPHQYQSKGALGWC